MIEQLPERQCLSTVTLIKNENRNRHDTLEARAEIGRTDWEEQQELGLLFYHKPVRDRSKAERPFYPMGLRAFLADTKKATSRIKQHIIYSSETY